MANQAIVPVIHGLWKATPRVPLVFTVDTTLSGSASDHFILPLNAAGTYNFLVDWGDASTDTITTFNDSALDHTYSVGGVKTISIFGICTYIFFNNTGDRQKLIDITQWGGKAFNNLEDSFKGCVNLVGTWTDAPDLSAATSMEGAFSNCSLLTGSFNNWDVSTITTMFTTFSSCPVFNSPLNLWDTSSVTTMGSMFSFGGIFNQDISAWNVESCTTFGLMFDGQSSFNQSLDNWNPISCISINRMFEDCTVFNSSLNGWGSATSNITQFSEAFKNCTAYNQSMASWDTSSGLTAKDMLFLCTSFNQNLNTWDVSTFTNMQGMFIGASAYNQSMSTWATTSATNMTNMFFAATLFNQDISGFDITGVTSMSSILTDSAFSSDNLNLLYNAWVLQSRQAGVTFDTDACYDEPISGASRTTIITTPWTVNDGGTCIVPEMIWTVDTEKSGSANDHFIIPLNASGTYNFVVDWGDTNTDTITTFNDAALDHTYAVAGIYTVKITGICTHIFFNSAGDTLKLLDITQWGHMAFDTMESAFKDCDNLTGSFTDIPDVGAVTDMSSCFEGCDLFNGNIDNWNVFNVTDFSNMFRSDNSFLTGLSSWNTSNALNMDSMFEGAINFNGNITTWDVSNVTNFNQMFRDSFLFNQAIGVWDTSSALTTSEMFFGVDVFNQPLGSWDVSNVTNMNNMFNSATVFNQDISTWDISNVSTMNALLANTAFSTANLDLLYVAWALLSRQTGVALFSDAQFTIATSGAARATIVATPWTVTDGGGI